MTGVDLVTNLDQAIKKLCAEKNNEKHVSLANKWVLPRSSFQSEPFGGGACFLLLYI